MKDYMFMDSGTCWKVTLLDETSAVICSKTLRDEMIKSQLIKPHYETLPVLEWKSRYEVK